MRITGPQTGKSYIEKRRRRYNEPGQPRELTFRQAIEYLKMHAPQGLDRLTVREGTLCGIASGNRVAVMTET